MEDSMPRRATRCFAEVDRRGTVPHISSDDSITSDQTNGARTSPTGSSTFENHGTQWAGSNSYTTTAYNSSRYGTSWNSQYSREQNSTWDSNG